MGTAVPDRVKPSFWHPGTLTLMAERQSARMSKWRLNPIWHRMLYSCTHMATVGVNELNHKFSHRTVDCTCERAICLRVCDSWHSCKAQKYPPVIRGNLVPLNVRIRRHACLQTTWDDTEPAVTSHKSVIDCCLINRRKPLFINVVPSVIVHNDVCVNCSVSNRLSDCFIKAATH